MLKDKVLRHAKVIVSKKRGKRKVKYG